MYHYPPLSAEQEKLVGPLTRGDFDSPLRWTCKSVSRLAGEFSGVGITVGRDTMATELHKLGYNFQANQKTLEGHQHPDRNAQFEHINVKVSTCMRKGMPVISVDTKKLDFLENPKNPSRSRKGFSVHRVWRRYLSK